MDENDDIINAVSRRTFVGTVAAAAGMLIVPRHVLGGTGYHGAERQGEHRDGRLPVTAMGTSNTNALLKLPNVNIVALCDVDDSEAARKASAKLHQAVPNAAFYKDYRVMLEKQKDIDGVVVATPDHTHAVVAMAAMQLGKHVYVQKPLTHTMSEARALTEAARKYKVVTQMGNQGHSGEGVRLIEEWIDDGAIGKVHEVHCWTNRPIWPQGMQRPTDTPPVPDGLDWDLWIGPAPMRPFHPAYHPTAGAPGGTSAAGALGDMACHVMDAAYQCLKLGYPTSVTTHMAYNVVREQDRSLGQPREIRRRLPARDAGALHVPGARKEPAGGEAALVRRRPAAGAPRRARAAVPPARERDDLRWREGQDSCARPTRRARA